METQIQSIKEKAEALRSELNRFKGWDDIMRQYHNIADLVEKTLRDVYIYFNSDIVGECKFLPCKDGNDYTTLTAERYYAEEGGTFYINDVWKASLVRGCERTLILNFKELFISVLLTDGMKKTITLRYGQGEFCSGDDYYADLN